ncbi:two-component system capsular synthesis response regulator RcsB [Dyella sp. SG562]|uniref:response regulator n=1 Tax=Dyella TaxID=231454 RepID=UPI0014214DDF|nr:MULTISPECIES: response regulator [unclassified Dyella]NII75876.1 two-component system capsular synthesis response regulator RcsB [Dyella sp. SG562]NKJ21604.1 two-component system capsular synthesis response regulator RcsB [Dyella sp. SG609]
MIRVIVADDHPVVVIGVKTVLERHGDIKVVGEACNGSELIDRLDRLPCDVIITDFSMPGDAPDELSGEGGSEPRHADGLPLITLLATRYPQIPVIVLTMLNNVAVLRAIREKGMKGLAYKKSFATDLPNAVRAVKRGDTYVSPSLRERFHQREHSPETIAKELSPCEMEVLRLYGLAQLTVTQIAERLHRSIKTVSAQKRSGMKKLGILHDSAIGEYLEKLGFR